MHHAIRGEAGAEAPQVDELGEMLVFSLALRRRLLGGLAYRKLSDKQVDEPETSYAVLLAVPCYEGSERHESILGWTYAFVCTDFISSSDVCWLSRLPKSVKLAVKRPITRAINGIARVLAFPYESR